MRKLILICLFFAFAAPFASASLLPVRCTFSPELDCLEYVFHESTGELAFRARNNAGATGSFLFSAANLASSTKVGCLCNGIDACSADPGRVMNVSCVFPKEIFLKQDAKYKIEIHVNFTGASGRAHPLVGEIYGYTQESWSKINRSRLVNWLLVQMAFVAIIGSIIAAAIWKRKLLGPVLFWFIVIFFAVILLLGLLYFSSPIIY